MTVWTVGHSTRPFGAFVDALRAHGIGVLVDVRRFPASRRHPQYNGTALKPALVPHGIEYHGLPELGGRRNPRADSRNTAWRNRAFRGYADYMETVEFRQGIERLLLLAGRSPTAMMCAEALWWQCHRALIADCLTAGGTTVIHIQDAGRAEPHRYSSAAHVVDGALSYAGGQLELPPS